MACIIRYTTNIVVLRFGIVYDLYHTHLSRNVAGNHAMANDSLGIDWLA